MEQGTNRKKEKLISVAVLVAIVVIVAAATMFVRREADAPQPAAKPAETSTATTPSAGDAPAAVAYKDGTYSAEGSYNTPGGRESIAVALTLKDNKVADVNVQGNGRTEHSKLHQQEFESGYKPLVVGKPLDEISLSRVSGSSLTSQGFNDALARIADQSRQ